MNDEILRRPSISEVATLVEPKANKDLIMA